ncbi:hypothetical protein AGMMS50267_10770 [Spirochaetia bacterium]|nr:hypothetical protein AGMMS50267_10770 [Spirochaetia bacterium]
MKNRRFNTMICRFVLPVFFLTAIFALSGCPHPVDAPAVLKSIKVTQTPYKTSYAVGEAFDDAGLEVTGVYSDNSTRILTGYDLSEPNTSVAGNLKVTVSIDGKTTTFRIVVLPSAASGIALDVTGTWAFPDAGVGYGAQDAKTVTVTNTGTTATGALTVTLSSGAAFTLGSGASTTSLPSIAAGGAGVFTVVPKTALPLGLYTDTVTVSGGDSITAGFAVSFMVNPPRYSIALDPAGTWTFPAAGVGYGAQTAKSVAVINTGNQDTGALTASLSGTNSGSFALGNGASTTSLPSIALGGTGVFTVVPKAALPLGTYTAMVTVSGSNGITASIAVSFTVESPSYGIDLDVTGTWTFPSAGVGYGTQTAKTVTVINTGNMNTGTLTASLSGANSGSFALGNGASTTVIPGIAASGTGVFAVVPKLALPLGTYTASVTVTGENNLQAVFDVSFTVTIYSIGLDITGLYTFPNAVIGYAQPMAKSVTVRNTGAATTGPITIALSGTSSRSFTLSSEALPGIAVGETGSFTVVPNSSLAAGQYTATVTVSGGNTVSFDIRFAVDPPRYGISLDVTGTWTFPTAQASKLVTVTNTGNRPTGTLTVSLSGASNGPFTLSTTALSAIAPSGTGVFTVVPKPGLAAGTYTATVMVRDGNGNIASFGVSFTPGSMSSGIALDVRGALRKENPGEVLWVLPMAGPGYAAQTPASIDVLNTGTQATGTLTASLSGTNSVSFVLNSGGAGSSITISSIGVGGTSSFSLAPITGLGLGTYTATVTVSGSNGITASVKVSFTVGVLYLTGQGTFPDAVPGYGPQAPKTVTVTNMTNSRIEGSFTVSLSGSNFTLSATSLPGIEPGLLGAISFTIVPIIGLAAGTYTDTVTVSHGSGITAGFDVSFTVADPSYGIHVDIHGAPWYGYSSCDFPDTFSPYVSYVLPKTVIITNTGNQPTGPLTLSLGNETPLSGAFVLSKTTIGSIPVGGTANFDVYPNRSSSFWTSSASYEAKVSISGSNGISADVYATISMTYEAPQYAYSIDPDGPYTLPYLNQGYRSWEVKTVTITNMGNQAFIPAVYFVGDDAFDCTQPPRTYILPRETCTFKVWPKSGLALNFYTADVEVRNQGGDVMVAVPGALKLAVGVINSGIDWAGPYYRSPIDDLSKAEVGKHFFWDGARWNIVFDYTDGGPLDGCIGIVNMGSQATGVLRIVSSNPEDLPVKVSGYIGSGPMNSIAPGGTNYLLVVWGDLSPGTHTTTIEITSADGLTMFLTFFFTITITP